MKSWFRWCQKAHTVPHSFGTSLMRKFRGFWQQLGPFLVAQHLWCLAFMTSGRQEEPIPLTKRGLPFALTSALVPRWKIGDWGAAPASAKLVLFPGSRIRDHTGQATGCGSNTTILVYQWADPEWWNPVGFESQAALQIQGPGIQKSTGICLCAGPFDLTSKLNSLLYLASSSSDPSSHCSSLSQSSSPGPVQRPMSAEQTRKKCFQQCVRVSLSTSPIIS